ncbi:uncharacterized protein J3R85_007229 [Psidium guajava]|nr:uncharacterized protein J3R85_007229 [Psidium guajava]
MTPTHQLSIISCSLRPAPRIRRESTRRGTPDASTGDARGFVGPRRRWPDMATSLLCSSLLRCPESKLTRQSRRRALSVFAVRIPDLFLDNVSLRI